MVRRPPLVFIFSVTVAGILANTLLSPNIPDILATFDQPESRAGLLVASGPLPGVLVAPIIGIVADRLGRRRVLLPCLVLFGGAGLAVALAPSFELLLVARVVQGVGGAGLINLAVVMIGDFWTGVERTTLIGRNSAVLTVCLALMPSFSGLIASVSNWRWSLACSSLALPIAAFGYRTMPRVDTVATRTIGEQLLDTRRALRQPVILAVIASATLLFMVIFGVFLTTLPVHLEKDFGLGPGARGLILSAPAIGSTLVAFNLGRIRSRSTVRTVLVASSALISISALAIGIAPTVVLIVVASVIYGLGDGLAIPTLQDVTASSAPDGQRASVMAGFVSATRLGQTIGPIGASAIFAATSTSAAMLVGAAVFAVVAVGFLIGPIDEKAIARSAGAPVA
ncbi:MAG: MFS transporter [Acidimicrobiales bacterium]